MLLLLLLFFRYMLTVSYAPVTVLGQGHTMNKIDSEQGQVLNKLPEMSFLVAKAMMET